MLGNGAWRHPPSLVRPCFWTFCRSSSLRLGSSCAVSSPNEWSRHHAPPGPRHASPRLLHQKPRQPWDGLIRFPFERAQAHQVSSQLGLGAAPRVASTLEQGEHF